MSSRSALEFPAGFTVAGIIERGGAPLSGVFLDFEHRDGDRYALGVLLSVRSDAAGRFRLAGIPPGVYEVSVTSERGTTKLSDLEVTGDEEIRLVMP